MEAEWASSVVMIGSSTPADPWRHSNVRFGPRTGLLASEKLRRSVVWERRGPKVIHSSTSISHAAAFRTTSRCANFDLRNVLLSSLSALL